MGGKTPIHSKLSSHLLREEEGKVGQNFKSFKIVIGIIMAPAPGSRREGGAGEVRKRGKTVGFPTRPQEQIPAVSDIGLWGHFGKDMFERYI